MKNDGIRKIVKKKCSGKGGPGAPSGMTGDSSGMLKRPVLTKTALTAPAIPGADIGMPKRKPLPKPSRPLPPISKTDPRIPRSTGMVPRGWANDLRKIQK